MLFSWVEQRVLIIARFSVILVLTDSLSFFLILSFFASWVERFIRLLRCFFGGQAETGFLFFVHQVFCIFFLVHALSCLCGERSQMRSQMISLVLLFCLEKRHAYLRNRRIRLHVQSVFESERKSVDVEKVMMIVVRIYLLEGWLETWFKQICCKREKLCHEMLKDWRLRFLELESCFMSPASSWLLALHLQLNESSWEMYDVEYVCPPSLSTYIFKSRESRKDTGLVMTASTVQLNSTPSHLHLHCFFDIVFLFFGCFFLNLLSFLTSSGDDRQAGYTFLTEKRGEWERREATWAASQFPTIFHFERQRNECLAEFRSRVENNYLTALTTVIIAWSYFDSVVEWSFLVRE